MDVKQALVEIGAVKHGTFTLKSGATSPVYVDLRLTISYPKLLVSLAEALFATVHGTHFDRICGVPYTALPFATALSIAHNIPMILKRKERKEHGTGKTLEGVFQKGDRILVIEDVVTSGQSILETVTPMREEGLVITDVAAIVDREQGGKERLLDAGIRLHTLCTLRDLL